MTFDFEEMMENKKKSVKKLKDIAKNFDDYDAVFVVASSKKDNSVAVIKQGNPLFVMAIAELELKDFEEKIDSLSDEEQSAMVTGALMSVISHGTASSSLADLIKHLGDDIDD